MVDKATHSHEKSVRKEHDAAKALNKAQHTHDARVADEQSALKTIEVSWSSPWSELLIKWVYADQEAASSEARGRCPEEEGVSR
jgi:hypothetical protein